MRILHNTRCCIGGAVFHSDSCTEPENELRAAMLPEVTAGESLWEGGALALIPESEYSLLERGYGNMTGVCRRFFHFCGTGGYSETFRKPGECHKKERKRMTKKEKILLKSAVAFAAVYSVAPVSNAMHIMEGYLPAGYCIAWGVICLPFLIAGYISLRNRIKENRKNMTLIAMAGAFIFVISSLKIPSVSGSCSHMTGTGLGAVLLGPAAVSILGMIVLIFQALLLAHGGLTTLGANTFSMAVSGPLVSFGVYRLCGRLGVNRRISIFLAAFLGDMFTYCVTSVQLALANPSEAGGVAASVVKFLGVFAPTQLPLAVIEGLITVVILIGLETYAGPELRSIGFIRENIAQKKEAR